MNAQHHPDQAGNQAAQVAGEILSLTVSVVTYDSRLDELHELLDSLLTALAALPPAGLTAHTRVSLVDNSEDHNLKLESFAGFLDRLGAQQAELRIVSGQGNVGYGRGHNLVIGASSDRYHLLLNPDVVLAPDSLVAGLAYLQQHPEVAVVSPYAENRAGDKQYLCKRHPSVSTLFVRGFLPGVLKPLFRRRLARYEMHDLPENQASAEVPMISGCCMLCRGAALRAVGGFDENYFLYFEDFDLSLRLGQVGTVAYLPDMKIRHHGGNAAGKGLRHIALFTCSAWRFFNTYGWRFL